MKKPSSQLAKRSAPKGYRDVSRPSIAGWYTAAEKNSIEGTIVGFGEFEGKFGPRRICAVLLSGPCNAVMKKSPVTLVAGEIVAVGHRYGIGQLWQYDVGTEVLIEPLGLKALDDGRKVWEFFVAVQNDAKLRLVQPGEVT